MLRLEHCREGASRLPDLRHAARLRAAGAWSKVARVRGQAHCMGTGPRHRAVLHQHMQCVTPHHAQRDTSVDNRSCYFMLDSFAEHGNVGGEAQRAPTTSKSGTHEGEGWMSQRAWGCEGAPAGSWAAWRWTRCRRACYSWCGRRRRRCWPIAGRAGRGPHGRGSDISGCHSAASSHMAAHTGT